MALRTSDAAGKAPEKAIVSVDCPNLPIVFKRLPALVTGARLHRRQSMSRRQKYPAHSDTKTTRQSVFWTSIPVFLWPPRRYQIGCLLGLWLESTE